MLQTSSCEDIHVASVSLRAALLLPTRHSEMLNNGIHEYSAERQNRKKAQACSSALISGSLQLYYAFIVIYSILLKQEIQQLFSKWSFCFCMHGLKSIKTSLNASWSCDIVIVFLTFLLLFRWPPCNHRHQRFLICTPSFILQSPLLPLSLSLSVCLCLRLRSERRGSPIGIL